MAKNTILIALLVFALLATWWETGKKDANGQAATASEAPSIQTIQQPSQTPATLAQQIAQNQPNTAALTAGAQQVAQNQPNMPGQPQPQPQLQPQPQAQPAVYGFAQQYANPPNAAMGNMGSMGGMGCMGMGNMGGMGGMSNMGSMGGMGMNTGGMSHTMDQGLTMREIIYIVSMQDAIQLIGEMIQIQEKLIDDPGPKKEDIRKELIQIKEKIGKLSSDYRAIMTSQSR